MAAMAASAGIRAASAVCAMETSLPSLGRAAPSSLLVVSR